MRWLQFGFDSKRQSWLVFRIPAFAGMTAAACGRLTR